MLIEGSVEDIHTILGCVWVGSATSNIGGGDHEWNLEVVGIINGGEELNE